MVLLASVLVFNDVIPKILGERGWNKLQIFKLFAVNNGEWKNKKNELS
jgi:hypothetical protein